MLGHHYQREDIIQFADYRGDSFNLSRWAAEKQDAEYIVFCGVHFMAESADILSAPHQKVVLPNMSAGCSMADMADPEDVYACWDELVEAGFTDIVPVTYMNSAAALKAFCGKNGGIVCTSSNAPKVYDWALERGSKVLFFPDQHLGRNTGLKKGISLDEMVVWDYTLPYGSLGGNTREQLERAKVILWRGWCSVHRRFSVKQIEKARAEHPDVTGDRPPGVHDGSGAGGGHGRLDGVHHEDDYEGAGGLDVGRRHRDQPGVPAGAGEPGQDGVLPGPGRLPLRDDVPHPPRVPGLGAGRAGRGPGGEPGGGGRRDGARREGGAGAHA